MYSVETKRMLQALDQCIFEDDIDKIFQGLLIVDKSLESMNELLEQESLSPETIGQTFGLLCHVIAEFPPYRLETCIETGSKKPKRMELIEALTQRRRQAVVSLQALMRHPLMSFLEDDYHVFDRLLVSTLDPSRFMPFRVVQVGSLADKLFLYSAGFGGQEAKLLLSMHSFKYLRFGTSGWRGKWQVDFDERTANCVAKAVCDFLNSESVPDYVANAVPGASGRAGKTLVIGYDSRANARRIAEWVAHIAIANGFRVSFADRDTPTPALIYWALEVLGSDLLAGIINCTASHNPPEWQGIKFSPFNGVPAPTAITDFLASRANRLKLEAIQSPRAQRGYVSRQSGVERFDPKTSYCQWLLSEHRGGLPVNAGAIKQHFRGKTIVIDEMHGTSRGYFTSLMRRLGIKYKVIHGEKSHKALEQLGYASPEWPFIAVLAQEVAGSGAALGVGFDTDADRFGIVGAQGEYIPPNRILPMLTEHLLKNGCQGKVLRTVTGSRLIDRIAGRWSIPAQDRPAPGICPSYIQHAFYQLVAGDDTPWRGLPVFVVPVGIKYVIEGMLVDSEYNISYRPGFRGSLLLGGEESSGLTSKGHLPDKDGIWGNLLIMNMMATEGRSLEQLWKELCSRYGSTYFERVDVDAGEWAKERLVNYFMENEGIQEFAGLSIDRIGGIVYDFVEVQLHGSNPEVQVCLEIRASGTEPLVRVYTEAIALASTPESDVHWVVVQSQEAVLDLLEGFSMEEIRACRTERELASVLAVTSSERASIRKSVMPLLSSRSRRMGTLCYLEKMIPYLEARNRTSAQRWVQIIESVE